MQAETSRKHPLEEGHRAGFSGAGAPSGTEARLGRAPLASDGMAFISVALVFLTFIAFVPVLGNDFVYFDDVEDS